MKFSACKMQHPSSIFLIAFFLVFFSTSIFAESRHQLAERFANSGDILSMRDTYLSILKQDPNDIKAKLGYATSLSWLGNHEVAQLQYGSVLKQQPGNLEALIGLGYDHAWAGQFIDAEIQFIRAREIEPNNLGAQKGLGFTYLWNNQHQKAFDIFQSLYHKHPSDAEILSALGQAQLGLKQYEEAEGSFRLALMFSPNRADALDGLEFIQQRQKSLDLTIWVGDTSDGGDTGLREIIVGYWLNDDVRVWARLDNSLSLDNPALVRSGSNAETYYLGVMGPVENTWQGNIEIGFRDLPNNAEQKIFKAEAINIIDSNVFKLGAQLSPHSENYTDKLIYSAYGFPVSDKWRLEPSLFLSSSGAIDDREWRFVLFGEYLAPELWSIGASAGVGDISSDISSAEGSVFSANVLFSYPLSQKNRLNLSIRYEDSPSTSFTTMLVGIAIQL